MALAFLKGIYRWPEDFPKKDSNTEKFLFNDVIVDIVGIIELMWYSTNIFRTASLSL